MLFQLYFEYIFTNKQISKSIRMTHTIPFDVLKLFFTSNIFDKNEILFLLMVKKCRFYNIFGFIAKSIP